MTTQRKRPAKFNASAFIRSHFERIDQELNQGKTHTLIARELSQEASFKITAQAIYSARYEVKRARRRAAKQRAGQATVSRPRNGPNLPHGQAREKDFSTEPKRVIWNPNPDPKELL